MNPEHAHILTYMLCFICCGDIVLQCLVRGLSSQHYSTYACMLSHIWALVITVEQEGFFVYLLYYHVTTWLLVDLILYRTPQLSISSKLICIMVLYVKIDQLPQFFPSIKFLYYGTVEAKCSQYFGFPSKFQFYFTTHSKDILWCIIQHLSKKNMQIQHYTDQLCGLQQFH